MLSLAVVLVCSLGARRRPRSSARSIPFRHTAGQSSLNGELALCIQAGSYLHRDRMDTYHASSLSLFTGCSTGRATLALDLCNETREAAALFPPSSSNILRIPQVEEWVTLHHRWVLHVGQPSYFVCSAPVNVYHKHKTGHTVPNRRSPTQVGHTSVNQGPSVVMPIPNLQDMLRHPPRAREWHACQQPRAASPTTPT